jgi:signal recognition particle receptor subunit beta
MIEYDMAGLRLVLKIVYYGPAMSGKTTNLLRLHELLSPDNRGNLMMLDTKDDRTIFFDLLPFFLQAPSGLRIKVKLFTVPGQVQHDSTRKAALVRADGVVFVADSRLPEAANNRESFANLEKNLNFVGIDIDSLPVVVQFNKRDLMDIVPEPDILKVWEPTGIPVIFASALYGQGVIETFGSILGMVYDAVDGKIALGAVHRVSRADFISAVIKPRGEDCL